MTFGCLFLVDDHRKFETQLSLPYEVHDDDDRECKEAADAEYSILLMECLRVLIEGIYARTHTYTHTRTHIHTHLAPTYNMIHSQFAIPIIKLLYTSL